MFEFNLLDSFGSAYTVNNFVTDFLNDRHYLVIPVEHISTVDHLQRTAEDYQLGTWFFAIYSEYVAIVFLIYSSNDTTGLNCDIYFLPVNHMLRVGKDLLKQDAPDSMQYRYIAIVV